MNRFRDRIDQGILTSLDDLRTFYKAEVKRLHPDLQGEAVPAVDFARLRRDFDEACRYWQDRSSQSGNDDRSDQGLATRDAFLDEVRNLVARGFPVNVQAAAKNRAYAASIRQVAAFLAAQFSDQGFFPRANAEARVLKRAQPRIHWYFLQILWNLGDWRLTGFDFYRRIVLRHRDFIRPNLAEEGMAALAQFLDFLVDEAGC